MRKEYLNDLIKGFRISLGIILGLSLFFGIVFAISFHTAIDEILGGTFSGNFIFENNVTFNGNVSGISSGGVPVNTILTLEDNSCPTDYELESYTPAGYSSDLIPDMPSATAPSGVASQSSYYVSSQAAFYMFTDNTGTFWQANDPTGWASYQFASSQRIDKYTIQTRSDGQEARAPKDWIFEAYNGSSWLTLDSRTDEISWTAGEKREYEFTNENSYTTYRITISANNGDSGYVAISEMEMMSSYKDEIICIKK